MRYSWWGFKWRYLRPIYQRLWEFKVYLQGDRPTSGNCQIIFREIDHGNIKAYIARRKKQDLCRRGLTHAKLI